LNEGLTDDEFQRALPTFFQYFDLSNQQVFLRSNGRIGQVTWREWCEGIRFNLSRTTFHAAWEHVKERDNEPLNELRGLERKGFGKDPRSWMPWRTRLTSWRAH
jgi:hypothetical protein